MIEASELIFHEVDQETLEAMGASLATVLQPGDVLCLTGDLGAGKTTFSQSLLKALGVLDHVTSPTYTLMNLYQVREQAIWHMDAYRIRDPEELHELGFYDVLHTEAILLIEWADVIREAIPDTALWMELHYASHGRKVIISGHVDKVKAMEEVLKHVYPST
jgi:tRNA threonylcarbamoyladenosine biosynthesis protein TsaE